MGPHGNTTVDARVRISSVGDLRSNCGGVHGSRSADEPWNCTSTFSRKSAHALISSGSVNNMGSECGVPLGSSMAAGKRGAA